MNPVQFDRPGVWRDLFASALTLTDHLATVVKEPKWSFGGGTVLMLRLNHRHSKDIDLFVPDPQYLGHFSPDAVRPFITRHSQAFLARLNDYGELTREEFDKIDRITYTRPFDECMDIAERLLK